MEYGAGLISRGFEASDLSFLRGLQADPSMTAGHRSLLDFHDYPLVPTLHGFESDTEGWVAYGSGNVASQDRGSLLVTREDATGSFLGVKLLLGDTLSAGDRIVLEVDVLTYQPFANNVICGINSSGWVSNTASAPGAGRRRYEFVLTEAGDAATGILIYVSSPDVGDFLRLGTIRWKRYPAEVPQNFVFPDLYPGLPAWDQQPTAVSEGFSGLNTRKGLLFTALDGVNKAVRLPWSAYDLRLLSGGGSCMVSMFLTADAAPDTAGNYNSVAGFSYQTGGQNQWSLDTGPDGGTGASYRLGLDGQAYAVTGAGAQLGRPMLITFTLTRTGPSSFVVRVYLDKTLVQTSGPRSFPHADPVTGSPQPLIGRLNGFSHGWKGVVHRIQSAVIPDDFDIDTWLATEYDGNYDRFAA